MDLWHRLLICLAGALVFLIGNITIGKKREGGKRFVLFFGGAVFVVSATLLCCHSFDSSAFVSTLVSIFGVVIAVVLGLLGAAMIITSIMGSDDAVHYVFEAVSGAI